MKNNNNKKVQQKYSKKITNRTSLYEFKGSSQPINFSSKPSKSLSPKYSIIKTKNNQNLNGNFITGLTDADGSFVVSIRKVKGFKTG
jgi:hypothetical protein